MDDRFNEILEIGEIYLTGCQRLEDAHCIGFSVDEGYDDESEYSAVVLRVYDGNGGLRFHLSPYQAQSLAGMLLVAAKEVQTFQNIKELNK